MSVSDNAALEQRVLFGLFEARVSGLGSLGFLGPDSTLLSSPSVL